MIPARSDVLDFDEEQQTSIRQAPTMVSLHFIRSALRRRWLVCVLSAVLGIVAAAGFLVAFPVVHNARTTLLLAHEPEVEPTRAMATDVSLLRTRTVASRTIASLGLTMSPDDFIKSVTVVSDSSELLELKLTAPTDAEAERRLSALTVVYLQFRGEQLSAQSNALVQGMQDRINKLRADVENLSKQVEELSAATGSENAGTLSDTISQRAYVQGRIDNLEQEVEDATLRNRAVVSSSGVLDPPAAEVGGVKRRIALALASGLIGGAAIGCGAVLFFAIISDRLRRRSDVAGALEVPVPVSVRRIAPLPKRLQRLPFIRTLDGDRTAERLRLAHAIEMELPEPGRSGQLAVLSVDNAAEVRFAVAAAAADLVADGRSVVLMDLTSKGNLDGEVVRSMVGSTPGPTVLRPRGLPTLAGDAAELRVVDDEGGIAPSLEGSDVTLVLADLDPSMGTDYLLTWTDRVIIAVTAGRSSTEMVRTAGDLVRSTGLEIRIAALLHTERTDDSSGIAGFDRPIQIVEKHDRLALVGTTVAEEATAGEQTVVEHAKVAALREPAAEEETSPQEGEPAVEAQAVAEERPADEEQLAQEELTAHEDTEEEQPIAEQVEPAVEEQDESAVEEQLAHEQPTASEQSIQSDELTGEVEQIVDDVRTVEMQAVVDMEPAQAEEQDPVDQEQAALLEQPSEDRLAADDDATVQMAVLEVALADEQVGAAAAAEPPQESKGVNGWQIFFLTAPLIYPQPSPEDDELDWTWEWLDEPSAAKDADSALIVVDDDTELMAEPDEIPQSFVEIGADGWTLYIDVYPPVYLASATSSEDDKLNWNWDWDWNQEPAPAPGGQESSAHDSNGNGQDQNEAQISGKDQPTQAGHRSSRV